MARLLIYLSFLSLPSAEEIGTLKLTISYVLFVAAAPFLMAVFQRKSLLVMQKFGSPASFWYLLFLLVFLPINLVVGLLNEIEFSAWASRSLHLALVPFYYICLKLDQVDPITILKDICIIGVIETLSVFGVFFLYFDELDVRRATDFEGVIVFSAFLLCAAFYMIRKFDSSNRKIYMIGYCLMLLATILTGTRILMIAAIVLLFGMKKKSASILTLVASALIAIPLGGLGLLERFDLQEADNMITVYSKLEELQILFNFFLQSPIIGAGFGKAYQVSVANSEYNYTHNIILFYLGYGGLFGLLVGLYPICRLFSLPGYRTLAVSILLFYTSSTSFTNVKHSILLALLLIVLERFEFRYKSNNLSIWARKPFSTCVAAASHGKTRVQNLIVPLSQSL